MQLSYHKEKFYFESDANIALKEFFGSLSADNTHFLLADSNTLKHCYPALCVRQALPENIEILEVYAGEASKQIEIAKQLIETMLYYNGSRKSKLITLGGGMISDLGGFVASTFKRGIDVVHIPTSLLAMIDAAWGGKTAVNLGAYKNQMGTFHSAAGVYILPEFLHTLSKDELASGYGELFKHGLISGTSLWKSVQKCNIHSIPENEVLKKGIKVKTSIVEKDPFERNERKKLNLGHTFGHAFESYYLEKNQLVPHGICVISGIFVSVELSKLQFGNLPNFKKIQAILAEKFPLKIPEFKEITKLMDYLKSDKKNEGNLINFVVLKEVGDVLIDCPFSEEDIKSAVLNALKEVKSYAS